MSSTTQESMPTVRLAWSWRLPADAASVRTARDLVAIQAAHRGLDADSTRLVVSELAANAVQHTDGADEFVVSLRWQPGRCVIALIDNAPHLLPTFNTNAVDVEDTRGRGLVIVAQVADEVHVNVDAHHKAVCAVFHTAPRSDPSVSPMPLEPLAPIELEPSDLSGYAYRIGLPPAYPAQADRLLVHLTEAHAIDLIPALSQLRPLNDRVTALLAEGAALAGQLDASDAASLARAFVGHVDGAVRPGVGTRRS